MPFTITHSSRDQEITGSPWTRSLSGHCGQAWPSLGLFQGLSPDQRGCKLFNRTAALSSRPGIREESLCCYLSVVFRK